MSPPVPSISIGPTANIPYLRSDNCTLYKEVCVLAEAGRQFRFNKLLLASVSPMFREILSEHFSSPNYTSGEQVFISTEFSAQDIERLQQLCHFGRISICSQSDQPSLLELGVDLTRLNMCIEVADGTIIKMEEDQSYMDEDMDLTYEKPSTDYLEVNYEDENNDRKSYDPCMGELWALHDFDGLVGKESLSILRSHAISHGIAITRTIKKVKLMQLISEHYLVVHGISLKDESDVQVKEEDESCSTPKKRIGRPKKSCAVTGQRRTKAQPKSVTTAPEDLEQPDSYFYFPSPSEVPRDLSLIWQCARCSRGFNDRDCYRQHFRRHDLGLDYERAFICVRCMKFEAPNKKTIKQHAANDCPVRRHDDVESVFTYYCAHCEKDGQPGKTFNRSVELQRHMTAEHVNKGGNDGGESMSQVVPTIECSACGRQFPESQKAYLTRHMKDYGPFHQNSRCWACPEEFKSWDSMRKHLDEHHGGVFKHLCGFCGLNSFDSEEKLSNHKSFCRVVTATCQVKQVDGPETACTVCGELVQSTRRAVKQHLTDYHSAIGWKCDLCGQPFFSEARLQDHVQNYHMDKRYTCSFCEKSFFKRSTLKQHELMHGNPQFTCDQCGKKCHNQMLLRAHIKQVHDLEYRQKEDAKTKVCHICGWEGAQRNYKAHVDYSHVKDEQKCNECGEVFKGKMHLNKHIRLKHTFKQCEECGVTVSHVYLKLHMIKKHGDASAMRYQCNICHKGFMGKQNYNNHMNIHTGKKPHMCKFCDRTFGDNGNCCKHMRESHAEQYQAYKEHRKRMLEAKDTLGRIVDVGSNA